MRGHDGPRHLPRISAQKMRRQALGRQATGFVREVATPEPRGMLHTRVRQAAGADEAGEMLGRIAGRCRSLREREGFILAGGQRGHGVLQDIVEQGDGIDALPIATQPLALSTPFGKELGEGHTPPKTVNPSKPRRKGLEGVSGESAATWRMRCVQRLVNMVRPAGRPFPGRCSGPGPGPWPGVAPGLVGWGGLRSGRGRR